MYFTRNLFFLTSLILSFGALAQSNPLDKVADLMEKGPAINAMIELEKVKQNVKVALPARAYWYDYSISSRLLAESTNRQDSLRWSARMLQSYRDALPLDARQEYIPQMIDGLERLAIYYRQKSVEAALNEDMAAWFNHHDVYVPIALALGHPVKELVFQSAEYAKSVDSTQHAIRYYQMCVALGFEEQLAYANWISLLRVEKRTDRADSVMQLAAEKFAPERMNALVDALESYEKNLHFTALKNVQDALANDPDSPALHYLLGMVNLKTNRLDAAIEGFHRVEELLPEPYLTNFQLGNYYLQDGIEKNDAGSLSLARFYLEQCEAIQKNDLFLYLTLLKLYEVQKDAKSTARVRAVLTAE